VGKVIIKELYSKTSVLIQRKSKEAELLKILIVNQEDYLSTSKLHNTNS